MINVYEKNVKRWRTLKTRTGQAKLKKIEERIGDVIALLEQLERLQKRGAR